MMKNLMLSLFIVLMGSYCFAQGGLEGVIVETVDASAAGPGLVAHRVYIDLAPGFELQQIYGNSTNPLNISTTTSWFNDAAGAAFGDLMNAAFFLPPFDGLFPAFPFDSYVSLGGASSTEWGVQISDDVDATQDGRASLGPVNAVSILGTINIADNFGAVVTSNSLVADADGQFFTLTTNADIAPENRIYVGQFTTDGELSFALNIQTRVAGTANFTRLTAADTPALNYPGVPDVPGCIDPLACNTDPLATVDDGTCTYPVSCDDADACTTDAADQCDPLDCTNVAIDCDDGDPATADSCDPAAGCVNVGIDGCIDVTAVNFDPAATVDDGSCLYSMTFNVDMNCEAGFTQPSIESPLFGFCGGCVPLDDTDGDGIWSVTIDVPAGTFEYKYAVDNFAGQENLIDDMQNGATCAPITDFNSFANRLVTVVAGAVFNDAYGTCGICDPTAIEGCIDMNANNYNPLAMIDNGSCIYDVTFNVDLNCYDGNDPNIDTDTPGGFTTIAIEGPSLGWCGSCVELVDNGAGIWSVTLALPAGPFEYKYAHDTFAGQEQLADDMAAGASCAPITDFVNFANRIIEIPAALTTSDTYGSCDACVLGCTDATACNYDPIATGDDGSCELPLDCDDSDACTTDSYDCATSSCVNTAIDCDDNDACTTDSCDPVAGCVYAAVDCDDNDASTTDSCDSATGCINTPIACDDNDACTTDTSDPLLGCVNTPINCDDSDACTTDSCDPATGCVYAALDCDDGDACTTDSCDPATGCVYATVDCDDGDPATTDSCDPVTGCVNIVIGVDGCTNANASNFDPLATNDDGSCVYATTLNVDMNCEPAFGTVFVTGPFVGWCGDCIPLSDTDGDGVWSVTLDLPVGDLEYKYEVDNWASQEDLIDDMLNGGTCAPITDFANFANRIVTVGEAPTSTNDTYGSCDPCIIAVVPGCTDPAASNYDPLATDDDGSCTYDGNCDVAIDFEPTGAGADFTWTVFENGDNPPLNIVANPDASGVNTTATVAEITARQNGNPWAGVETMHGSDIGTFTLTPANSLIKLMVWKDTISDVGIKLVSAGGGALPEIKVANTLINQWEELTFDFSSQEDGAVGSLGTYDQIVIFPDFDLAGRMQDNIVYFDNFSFCPQAGVVLGCTDQSANNFDPLATDDDGSCTYDGDCDVAIDFEPTGAGADYTWTVFENGDNPPVNIIANPDPSGVNTSATVAEITARVAGMPWAGTETMHGADIGTFTLTPANSLIKLMVYKTTISDVGIKLVSAGGGALPEIKVANTLINQWEELTFDFSSQEDGAVGSLGTYDQIVIFPDFDLAGRMQDNVVYFDNFTFCPQETGGDILGCNNANAVNYDPLATLDDGSCLYATTLNVDMNCEPAFGTVFVTGPFAGWCGDCYPLSDVDGDGVWSITLDLPVGDLEYKYEVDNWASQEDLIDDMVAGGTCAPITDFASYANRIVTVGEAPTSTSDTYGSCDPCVPSECPALGLNIGDACDDGNFETVGDVVTANCECVGIDPCPNPVNDEAAGALLNTADRIWGVPGWDTFETGCATLSMQTCDDSQATSDTWYQFVAQAENQGILARANPGDPNAANVDMAVEIFDATLTPLAGTTGGACAESRSCFNNSGAGEIERCVPGGLTVGDTYFYRVYDANGAAAGSSLLVDTKVKTFAPHPIVGGCQSLVINIGHTWTIESPNNLYNIPPVPVFFVRMVITDLSGAVVAMTPPKNPQAPQGLEFTLSEFVPLLPPGDYNLHAQNEVKMMANGCISAYWSQLGPACAVTLGGVPTVNNGLFDASMDIITFAAYPNPNNGEQVYLELVDFADVDASVIVTIVDMYGKQVHMEQFASSHNDSQRVITFNQNLSAGMYFINLTVNDRVMTQKLVVQ